MDERHDGYHRGFTRRDSVPEGREGKPWEVGNVKTGAERAVNENLASKIYERGEIW